MNSNTFNVLFVISLCAILLMLVLVGVYSLDTEDNNSPDASYDYYVTYDFNDSDGVQATQVYYSDNETYTVHISDMQPTKEGCKFLGWKCGMYVYIPGESVILMSTHSYLYLTAQWKQVLS